MPNNKRRITASFTRPDNTTAYTANDVVSNSDSASTPMEFEGIVRTPGSGGYIIGAILTTNNDALTPQFRVHLFRDADPTIANDNAAFSSLFAETSDGNYLGSFDLAAMSTPAGADESRVQKMDLRHPFQTAEGSRSIYAVLQAIDGFTPAAEQEFSLTLHAEID